MPEPIRYEIPKLDKFKIPTVEEMKNFASKYNKEDWNKLCKNKVFLRIFSENLDLAAIEVNNILKPKENATN